MDSERKGVEEKEKEEDRKPLASSSKETREPSAKGEKSNTSSFSNPSTVAASLAILVLGLLFRTGWTNVILVLLCSV